MKTRHIAGILTAAALMAWTLASCNLNPVVSIDQRISDFQSDISNNPGNAYNDFDPDQTTEYQTLAYGGLIQTLFPAGSYTLQVTDESSPSTGVLVTVTSYPVGFTRIYLKLVMATYKSTDWRIVQLFMSTSTSFGGTPSIY